MSSLSTFYISVWDFFNAFYSSYWWFSIILSKKRTKSLKIIEKPPIKTKRLQENPHFPYIFIHLLSSGSQGITF